VALNITSMLGGRSNPWREAVGKIAIENPYSRTEVSKSSIELER
jgi:hypothetical protein